MEHDRMIRTRLLRRRPACRRGNILAITAVFMTVMVAFLALTIDIGYLNSARTDLQRSADAAAIAATWELMDRNGQPGTATASHLTNNANAKAAQFAALNKIGTEAPQLASGDVV